MTAVWIPPVDRSKFMANMMASSLGAAITMPICGFLIEYVNWQSVFYVTGKHETNMIEFVRNSWHENKREAQLRRMNLYICVSGYCARVHTRALQITYS